LSATCLTRRKEAGTTIRVDIVWGYHYIAAAFGFSHLGCACDIAVNAWCCDGNRSEKPEESK
ncbi:hypothetical protein, partial [Mesorhizobium sp.]